jgi:PPOX class probable F420-dependent enzyme
VTGASPHIEHEARKLTDAQRAFLGKPYVGVVTDLRPDGSPHSTVVWVDVDDDGVSFNTAWPRAKPRYLEQDPRVSLTVLDPEDPYRWISITGTAAFVDEGANDQIDRLAKKYTGADSYGGHQDHETRVSVRISPTRIESRGID